MHSEVKEEPMYEAAPAAIVPPVTAPSTTHGLSEDQIKPSLVQQGTQHARYLMQDLADKFREMQLIIQRQQETIEAFLKTGKQSPAPTEDNMGEKCDAPTAIVSCMVIGLRTCLYLSEQVEMC